MRSKVSASGIAARRFPERGARLKARGEKEKGAGAGGWFNWLTAF